MHVRLNLLFNDVSLRWYSSFRCCLNAFILEMASTFFGIFSPGFMLSVRFLLTEKLVFLSSNIPLSSLDFHLSSFGLL